jgi:exopolyphosphatase/guanosine-5'-triphosphate,3'-diphosphate pyrophosphatase
MSRASRRIGVIDVGTNSVHLLIVDAQRDGTRRVVRQAHTLTRLGDGGLSRGALTGESMRRVMRTLRRYVGELRARRVDGIEAVATSAVRDAANGRAFARRIRSSLGLPIRIISGREEARLIYAGVVQADAGPSSKAIISIGGGSVQIMIGNRSRLRYAVSVPLGCARLAQRFIRHDPPQPQEVDRMTREVRRRLTPVARAMRRHPWREALGSSSTIAQLSRAVAARPIRAGDKGPLRLTRRGLGRMVQRLSRSTAAARRRITGLDPHREDHALPTAVALLSWMELCGVSVVRYAPGSLREGLVRDRAPQLFRSHRRAMSVANAER